MLYPMHKAHTSAGFRRSDW